MRIETEFAGDGDKFDIPTTKFIYPPKIKFHKVRKKNTNFTSKKKKRK